jgi:hypothetical protein
VGWFPQNHRCLSAQPQWFFFVCFDLSLIPPTTKKQSLSLIKIVVVWVLNHKDFSIENMEDPDFGFFQKIQNRGPHSFKYINRRRWAPQPQRKSSR